MSVHLRRAAVETMRAPGMTRWRCRCWRIGVGVMDPSAFWYHGAIQQAAGRHKEANNMSELGINAPALIAQIIFFILIIALIWFAVWARNRYLNRR